MNIPNQIIVSENGHSWLGFWTRNEKFNQALDDILKIAKRYKEQPDDFEYKNAFWVLDFDGTCRAAQRTLAGALYYYNPLVSTLVHYQSTFASCNNAFKPDTTPLDYIPGNA